MDVLLGPGLISDTWTRPSGLPGFEFDESTVFGDVCHLTRQLHADRILGGYAVPRIAFELLHAEADALGFRRLMRTNLHGHGVTDIDDFAGVV